MGRVLRIGTDTGVNYQLLATSGYDANNPPGTTGAWPDSLAMDQSFTQLPLVTVTAQGALVSFARFPDTFLGAMVKIKPTYDTSVGEAPAFEMWTNSLADGWVLRRHIDLTNVFVGVPTGTYKVLDLTFFPFLRGITQVWLTLNPGTVGTPTVGFVAIQLYGQCDGSLRNDHGGGPGGACDDPTDPFYTGFDNEGNPCPGTTFGPPAAPDPPTLDVCNAASIANYRAYAQTIPGYVEVFDAWLEANALLISQACAGTGVGGTPSPPSPPSSPPALPALDLCDQDSVDAFRAALSGNPDQVTAFNAYIDGLTAAGFFDLVCAPPEPAEVPVDPLTLEPVDPEPPNPPVPFGSGPGGQPQFPRPGNARGPTRGGPPAHYATTVTRYVFFFRSLNEQSDFVSGLANEQQFVQDAWDDTSKQVFYFGNGTNPIDNPGHTPGAGWAESALDRVTLLVHGAIDDSLVNIDIFTANAAASPSNVFSVYEASKVLASVSSSSLVDFLIERTSGLDGIPGTSPEPGGDGSATVSQRRAIVPETGNATAVLTVITAYDNNAHTISGSPSTSDENEHSLSPPFVAKKHLATAFDVSGPPGTNIASDARYQRLLLKVTVTNKLGQFFTANDPRVYLTVTPTTTTSV